MSQLGFLLKMKILTVFYCSITTYHTTDFIAQNSTYLLSHSFCGSELWLWVTWLLWSVGEGNGNPLQYSCLENPVDRGAWWAAVHGIVQSWTQLKRLSMHALIGEGNGNPLQYSCLENPRDRGDWWAAVCGVDQSWTRLKQLSSSSSSSMISGLSGWN